MRRLYSFLFYLLIPVLLLRLFWKGRRLPAYRSRIGERFSLGKGLSPEIDVWIHAVSLGEVVAATPLVDALLAKKLRILVTTMTPTGSERVLARFGTQVSHQYIPYDLPWAVRRFLKTIKARIGIIFETELWPNIIYWAKQMKMPLIIVNARISDSAFRHYYPARFLFNPILKQVTCILAQSDDDAKRFIALGALEENVSVCGNIKFDLQTQVPGSQNYMQLKQGWGEQRTVLIAASTHDDEERQILARLTTLKERIPDLLLLIAPRHPERFQAIYQMGKELGFKTVLRSQPEMIDNNTEVVVVDSLGELLGFYQLSDFAFVGGSLVPVGGHNVLEPIAMRVPVFTGPYMHNSKSICRDLCAAGAMQMTSDVDALVTALITMHHNKGQRERQIENANTVLVANQGSVARCLQKIDDLLDGV